MLSIHYWLFSYHYVFSCKLIVIVPWFPFSFSKRVLGKASQLQTNRCKKHASITLWQRLRWIKWSFCLFMARLFGADVWCSQNAKHDQQHRFRWAYYVVWLQLHRKLRRCLELYISAVIKLVYWTSESYQTIILCLTWCDSIHP